MRPWSTPPLHALIHIGTESFFKQAYAKRDVVVIDINGVGFWKTKLTLKQQGDVLSPGQNSHRPDDFTFGTLLWIERVHLLKVRSSVDLPQPTDWDECRYLFFAISKVDILQHNLPCRSVQITNLNSTRGASINRHTY